MDDERYEPKEKKRRRNVPLDCKIKVVNLVRRHPSWGLETLRKKGSKH